MQWKTRVNLENQPLKKSYYHLSARTPSDEYFKTPMPRAWKECIQSLKLKSQGLDIDINGFVLMNNHYHLILKSNLRDLSKFQKSFTPLGLPAAKYELISNGKYLFHAYRYIYQNPLRAGLTRRIEDYPYSFISCMHKKKRFEFPVIDKFGFNDEYKLYWLNELQTLGDRSNRLLRS